MLLEISLIAVGIPGGWLLRRQKTAQKIVSNVLTWTVNRHRKRRRKTGSQEVFCLRGNILWL